MDKLIEDYKAKNFQLNIEGKLYAVNRGLDFDGFLDTRQALGAEMLMTIIKDLDDKGLNDWVIFGWYGDQGFGEDYNGRMDDGTSFFNEAYFINELKMNDLWMRMPCLCLRTGRPNGDMGPKVYLSMLMSPYMRENIMDPIDFTDVTIDNEDGGLFPGPGACMKVRDWEYKHYFNDECSVPNILTFKMPQTFCVKIWIDGVAKDSWVFILPEDIKEMSEKLRDMIRKERDE